jgi:hypothetical protein
MSKHTINKKKRKAIHLMSMNELIELQNDIKEEINNRRFGL